jgi:radical SAM protein with 4Fe4S-binding SPASM domain
MDTLNASALEQSLSFMQYYRTLQNIQSRFGNVEGVFCSGFIPGSDISAMLKGIRCPAGTTKLSVMPDGSVYPCYLLFGRPEFRLGNILNDNFKNILGSPILNFFRRFEENNCPNSACELFSLCHGGCPAVSLMIYGDLNAPDPRCAGF